MSNVGKKVVAVLERKCLVCGRTITVKVYEDGSYEGGHFFGSLKEAAMRTGLYDPSIPDEEYEYWECDSCAMGEGEREQTGGSPEMG